MNDSFLSRLSFNKKILFYLSGLLMVIVSIYLTNHYYEVKFPSGFSSGSICNINSFLSCDSTTLSPFSNIAGVPISIFGIIMGAMVLLFGMMNSKSNEGGLFNLMLINSLGCIILFIYSLMVLQSLCPFCTVYYILSWFVLFVMIKAKASRKLDIKFFSIGVALIIISGAISYSFTSDKSLKTKVRSTQIVNMFKTLKDLGAPKEPSPYRLASASMNFEDAPIQMSIFSDFQCPACNAMNLVLPKIEEKYQGKINIQYYFFPLDHNCNENMKSPLHPLACKAAYIASCVPNDKFKKVHDEIFAYQARMDDHWLNKLAERYDATECSKKAETKEMVVAMLKQAGTFGVKSTPTQLINGVKIEGVRPLSDYYAIMDYLLEKNGK